MALAPGARLGPYEIVAPLGAGGMGEVYRARDSRLDRDVAVKVLPADVADDASRLARFEREAKAIAALSHPNILAIYDVGHELSTAYVVTELLEGETLRERIVAGALPVRKAIEYGAQVADGLAAAHEKGIVHRDLKPENIFITRDDRAKLLDFGLAKTAPAPPAIGGETGRPESPTITAVSDPRLVVGTVGYMAPEQVRAHPVDHRADIFAFGATLYEMVTGRRAFHGATSADTMTAVLDRDVAPMILPDGSLLPPALERVVLRCLEKNPAARFQSTTDLAFALRAPSTTSQAAAASSATAVAAPRRRRWAVVVLAFLAGLTAATTLLLLAPRPGSARSHNVVRFAFDVPASRAVGTLALSPDGTHLAYDGFENGVGRLFVRAFDQAADVALGGTDGAESPFFSPDGAWIAFFTGNRLNKVPAAGGNVETICAMPAQVMEAASPTRSTLGASGTWSPDGAIVFSAGGSGLWRVAPGSAPAPLTTLDSRQGDLGHAWPDLLPDGRTMLFSIWTGMTFDAAPIAVSPGGAAGRQVIVKNGLAPRYLDTGHLLYAAEGSLVAVPFDARTRQVSGAGVPIGESIGYVGRQPQFAVSRAGDLAYAAARPEPAGTIVRVDRGGRVEPVADMPAGVAGAISLAPDTRRLMLYCRQNRKMTLWSVDIARGVVSRIATEGNPHAAIWAPDGRRIFFSSDRAGAANVFAQAADGSGDAQQLVTSPRHQDPGSCSRDGRWMVYAEIDPASGWDLWKLDTMTREKTLFHRSVRDEKLPSISPDGRWIAYTSDESGQFEVYAEAFPSGGQRVQLSANGGQEPLWSADGSRVFYRTDSALMEVKTAGGTPLSAERAVRVLEDHFARAVTLGPPGYAVSPDGRSFYFLRQNAAPPSPTRINVVLGWINEFRGR